MIGGRTRQRAASANILPNEAMQFTKEIPELLIALNSLNPQLRSLELQEGPWRRQ
jgi:hypothetical protein